MAGIRASDGSMNVTVVDGSSVVGGTNPDGSANVTVVNSANATQGAKALGTWHVLAADGTTHSITGTTDETTLATVTIPAGVMGPNGVLRVSTQWSYTNSASTKRMRTRLGGIGGVEFMNSPQTTSASMVDVRFIQNRNSQSSQVGLAGTNGGLGTSTGAPTTGTIDTSASTTLVFTATLTDTGETITLERYTVEVLYAG